MDVKLVSTETTLFDTLYLPSAINGQRAVGFIYPLGTQVFSKEGRRLKDNTDTNLLMAGMLPAPNKMEVAGISCLYVGQTGIIPIRSRWYQETKVRLQVNNRTVHESILSECAGTAALFAGHKCFEEMDTEKVLALQGKYQRTIEKFLIDTMQNFTAEFSFSDWQDGDFGLYPDKLFISLHGKLWHPTQ